MRQFSRCCCVSTYRWWQVLNMEQGAIQQIKPVVLTFLVIPLCFDDKSPPGARPLKSIQGASTRLVHRPLFEQTTGGNMLWECLEQSEMFYSGKNCTYSQTLWQIPCTNNSNKSGSLYTHHTTLRPWKEFFVWLFQNSWDYTFLGELAV